MFNLYAMTPDEITALLGEWGEPRYRAEQLHEWMYARGAQGFEEMDNLPKKLRERLQREAVLGDLVVEQAQVSKDGTEKRLYRLSDGQLIETVLMQYQDGRRTVCVSTQAGCAMGCVFCATGQMGFARHLTVGEIFEQAALFSAELKQKGERLSNIVLMGMGEPFHNYDAVIPAIRRWMAELEIGARHITVSTVGLAPAIRKFAGEGLQVRLAISLHASTNAVRSSILPVNKRYPLEDVLDACRYYQEKLRRRITFEWALIQGENDSVEEARRIAALLKGLICHVNLIPLNPTSGYSGGPSEITAANRFVSTLEDAGIPATIRIRRGIDIDAGCGQLKSSVLRPSS